LSLKFQGGLPEGPNTSKVVVTGVRVVVSIVVVSEVRTVVQVWSMVGPLTVSVSVTGVRVVVVVVVVGEVRIIVHGGSVARSLVVVSVTHIVLILSDVSVAGVRVVVDVVVVGEVEIVVQVWSTVGPLTVSVSGVRVVVDVVVVGEVRIVVEGWSVSGSLVVSVTHVVPVVDVVEVLISSEVGSSGISRGPLIRLQLPDSHIPSSFSWSTEVCVGVLDRLPRSSVRSIISVDIRTLVESRLTQ
jgi:hypothetical protein